MESPPAPSTTPAGAPAPAAFPIVAGLVAAAVGPLIWVGVYVTVGAVWIAPLLIGLLVGLAIRFTSRPGAPNWLALYAAALTALGCFVGYVWTDLAFMKWIDPATGQPVQPAFADAARRFLNDLFSILLIAIGAYIAYAVSRRAPGGEGSAAAPHR